MATVPPVSRVLPPPGPEVGRIPTREECRFTPRWSRERLKSLRKRGDPLADACVERLAKLPGGLTNIHDLLATVEREASNPANANNSANANGANPFTAFLDATRTVPTWVDMKRVEEGQRVQAVYSSVMGPSLLNGSLVGGSMFKSAAVVTAQAGNLADGSSRRVRETALMVAQLAFPGALKVGAAGHRTFARVRLLHAGLRYFLPNSGRYTRKDELPINQHDLAITLGLFGWVNVRSLARMGVYLTERERENFLHMWRYAAFVMGIDEDILPESLADQAEFFDASCAAEADPDWIPPQTKIVLDAIARDVNKDTWNMVSYETAQTFLHQLTRYLSGSQWCTGMQIEDLGDSHWAVRWMWAIGRVTDFMGHYVPLGDELLARINFVHVRRLMAQEHVKPGEVVGARVGSGVDATAAAKPGGAGVVVPVAVRAGAKL